MINLAKKSQCTGCMACIDTCSRGAIECITKFDGHYYPQIRKDKCIECGLCTKVCPIINTPHVNNSSNPITYAAWSDVNNYRDTSTSGGIFPTIAFYIIKQGGYAIGVTLEDSKAKHIVIDKPEEISLLQGSKYQQSNACGIYKQCKHLLKDGKKVVFSGTPCQIAGLHSYLKHDYDNLITIDVICAGVPSRLVIDKFKTQQPKSQILSYRDKLNGWQHGLNITTIEDKQVIRESKDGHILGQAVAGHQTDRYSCYNCQFAKIDRCADITIGDYWGGDKLYPEHKEKGLSVVIVHTQKGDEILKASGVSTILTDISYTIKKNPRIAHGKNLTGRYRLERRLLNWLIPKMPYNLYAALYAGVYKSRFYLPIKAYRYFMWKLDTKYIKTKIQNNCEK